MSYLKITTIMACSILVIGCGATKIDLQPLPTVNRASAPTEPAPEKYDLRLEYPKKGRDDAALEENTTVKGRFKVPLDSKVVISVPVEQQGGSRNRANLIGEQNSSDAGDNVFQTAEYFSKAEQEIEKSLLRKGFTVLDRAKFEAELRNRRTEERRTVRSEAMEQEIAALGEQRDAKRITRDEYIEKLRDIESKYEVFEKSAGRAAGERELVDIGELIRAAETGTVQADYILQVNRFEIGQISDKRVYLPNHNKLRTLIQSDLTILNTLEKQGKDSITQPGYFGYLNAKLIEVKTGSIVWVGEHRVESADATDIVVDLSISKGVANLAQVKRVADDFNRTVRKLNTEANRSRSIVNNTNLETDTRNRAKTQYDRIAQQIRSLSPEDLKYSPWQYKYTISQPLVSPRFPSAKLLRDLSVSGQRNSADYNRFLRLQNYAVEHQTDLAKAVSKELISTIPASE